MANISFDFSNKRIFHQDKKSQDNAANYIYRDINTSSILAKEDPLTHKEYVVQNSSSNFDMNAIKASLNNILNFKRGESILEPEFGISEIYEMLYAPFDKYTTEKMVKTLRDILGRWEPRIEILSIPTSYNEEKQEYHLTINYYVPMLNEQDSLVYSIQK